MTLIVLLESVDVIMNVVPLLERSGRFVVLNPDVSVLVISAHIFIIRHDFVNMRSECDGKIIMSEAEH